MAYHSNLVSADLIWEVTRNQNSFLVNRPKNGVRFSRDPLNLTNVHSRKYAGYVNDKAVGVAPAEGGKGVTLITKKEKSVHQPAGQITKVTIGGNKSNRKTYKTIASRVAKSGYRADLRAEAVSRASAIRKSQTPKKDIPEKKARGAKARKAEEAAKEE